MIKCFAGVLAAILLTTGTAQAVSFNGITEGTRDRVMGTTARSDVPGSVPGFPAGVLGAGDFYIFGRIVGGVDNYEVTFQAANAFTIGFHFGGYTTDRNRGRDNIALGDIAASGLVGVRGTTAKNVTFGLTGESDITFQSDVTSVADMAANVVPLGATFTSPVLFSGGAGNYTLSIDGRADRQIAYYDLKISVVPLPAGILLLLTALGGLGFAGWYRRREALTPAA